MVSRKKALISCGIVLGLLAASFLFYVRFEYTLVGDLREVLARPDPSNAYAYGKTLFETRGCAGCHAHDRAGSTAAFGPDLTGIAVRRSPAEIRQSIVDPAAVLAKCPRGPCTLPMPVYGEILSPAQVDALVTWLTNPTPAGG